MLATLRCISASSQARDLALEQIYTEGLPIMRKLPIGLSVLVITLVTATPSFATSPTLVRVAQATAPRPSVPVVISPDFDQYVRTHPYLKRRIAYTGRNNVSRGILLGLAGRFLTLREMQNAIDQILDPSSSSPTPPA